MKSNTPLLSDQLAELREQAVAIRARAREAQLAHHRAVEDIERLRETRVRALTTEDEKTAASLQAERDEAERTAADLDDRAEAARRAVADAEAEQGAYAAQLPVRATGRAQNHRNGTADDIEHAIGELTQAATRWHNEQAAVVELLRHRRPEHSRPTDPPGRDHGSDPYIPQNFRRGDPSAHAPHRAHTERNRRVTGSTPGGP